ncbi:unnamed protein product, partial [Prorocentrum cordatum]
EAFWFEGPAGISCAPNAVSPVALCNPRGTAIMQNALWTGMFNDASVNGEMSFPGVEGLQVLLEGNGMKVGDGGIGVVFSQKAWGQNRSLSKDDFMELTRAIETMHVDALLQRIAGRLEQQDFPYVLPSEMGQFRPVTPTDELVAEPVRRAKFMYNSYYALVVQCNVQRSHEDRRLRHRFTDGVFAPAIPVASFGDAARKDAAGEVCSSMTAALFGALDAKVWGGWDALTKCAPPTAALFEQCMSGAYFAAVTDVVSAPPLESIPGFAPLCPVEIGNASVAAQAERSWVAANAAQEDHAEVERILAASWEEEKQRIPSSCRAFLTAESAELFRRGKYCEALETVVSCRAGSGCATPAAPFAPKVNPWEGAGITEGAVRDREEMLTHLDSADAVVVDAGVIAAWKKNVDSAPPSIRAFLPEDPPQEFWVEEYYSAIHRVVGVKLPAVATFGTGRPGDARQADVLAIARRSAPLMADPVDAMEVAGGAAAGATAHIGPRSMRELSSFEGHWNFEGFVMHFDDQPRTTGKKGNSKGLKDSPQKGLKDSPQKRGSAASSSGGLAMGAMMMGRTGPVIVTLFDAAARDILQVVSSRTGPRSAQQPKVIFAFANVRVATLPEGGDWNGKLLTQVRALHSSTAKGVAVPGTVASAVTMPSLPHMAAGVAFAIPQADVCADFLSVRDFMKGPFRGTFTGVVANVEGASFTGMLYLMKDAFVFPVAHRDLCPQARIEITID